VKAGKFLSNYLRAKDVRAEQNVTISTVESETFNGDSGEREALVVYFKELEQGVVLCRTSLAQLVELFGDETDAWIGQKAVLYNDPSVQYKGKRVGGLRFRGIK